eukprot:gene18939-25506_t
MTEPSTPGASSVSRARELTGELKRLQDHVESLEANVLQDNVQKLHEQVARITQKLQATLAKVGASPGATPTTAGGLASALTTPVAAATAPRGKIAEMSAEVVDSNPYSRLMALQRMGIVKDYQRIRSQTAAVSSSRTRSVGFYI